jgi:hypothetical protein
LSVLARSHLGKLPKRTEQRYTGTVWCPTTTNGSFFARRRGSVYVTGNSRQATSYAYPNFFVPWGFPPNLTMQLYPVPSASGILNIYYYRLPAPITGTSADATVVEVVQGYEPLIEDYAEYMALRKDADPRWQEAKQIYEETLGAMIDGTRRFHDGVGWFSYGTNILPQWLVGAGGGGWD